jgi:ABC-type branched-subunit amino acid transport system substrate-binding protein
MIRRLAACSLSLLTLAAGVVHAQPSLQSQPLVIGMTVPLSGSEAAFGRGLQQGARLAVERANAAGGVGGRPLVLLALDDQGDAARAAANARQLLEQGAIAITGALGARATAAVAEALRAQAGAEPAVALVAPVTGAESLRDPPLPGLFHLRAGLAEEASAAMLHLDTIGVTRFAVLSQADRLGESGRERLLFEINRLAMRPLANETLTEGASPEEIKRVLDKVCALRPEAMVLATDATRARLAMAAARSQPCAAHYVVFSETGAALSERPAGSTGRHPLAGLMVTQVVPHPNNALHPVALEYQRVLAVHGAGTGSHASLEGYLAARVVQEALRPCARDPSRSCLLQSLATRTFDLPGMRVQFGAGQRLARPFVEITMLDSEGRFRR